MAHTRRHPTMTCADFGCDEPNREAVAAAQEATLSSASHRPTVVELVTILTTCQDSDLADALGILREHAPDSWEAMAAVMHRATASFVDPETGGYFYAQVGDDHRVLARYAGPVE